MVVSFGWSNWREDDKTIFEFPWAVLDTASLQVSDSGVYRIKPAPSTASPAVSTNRLTLAGLSLADLEEGISFEEAVKKVLLLSFPFLLFPLVILFSLLAVQRLCSHSVHPGQQVLLLGG